MSRQPLKHHRQKRRTAESQSTSLLPAVRPESSGLPAFITSLRRGIPCAAEVPQMVNVRQPEIGQSTPAAFPLSSAGAYRYA